jgi:two-component system OmpR family response regulator
VAQVAQEPGRVPEARLLVVDDEPNIVELLSTSLEFAGFEVRTAATGRDAVAAAAEYGPDLVVLDVMLPDMDGLEVLRLLREPAEHIPVVLLTAKDATEDKIAGLSLGGDDYVTKPFSLGEVLARVRAVLRRARATARSTAERPTRLAFADIELDTESHEVWKDSRCVTLSPTEFRLLRFLVEHPARALPKARILEHVWGEDFEGESNVVESYVSYLRRKVDTTNPRLIHTIRGVGYVLRVPQH